MAVLTHNTKVVVKNLGDNKEYRGKVVGVVLTFPDLTKDGKVLQYLIEMEDDFEDYNYSVIAIVPSCVFTR